MIMAGVLAWGVNIWAADSATKLPAGKLTVEPGHPWTPPFGLDRVGRPLEAVVEIPGRSKPNHTYLVVGYRDGAEVSRQPVVFLDEAKCNPWLARFAPPSGSWGRVALVNEPSEIALMLKEEARTLELTRAKVSIPKFEADANLTRPFIPWTWGRFFRRPTGWSWKEPRKRLWKWPC